MEQKTSVSSYRLRIKHGGNDVIGSCANTLGIQKYNNDNNNNNNNNKPLQFKTVQLLYLYNKHLTNRLVWCLLNHSTGSRGRAK